MSYQEIGLLIWLICVLVLCTFGAFPVLGKRLKLMWYVARHGKAPAQIQAVEMRRIEAPIHQKNVEFDLGTMYRKYEDANTVFQIIEHQLIKNFGQQNMDMIKIHRFDHTADTVFRFTLDVIAPVKEVHMTYREFAQKMLTFPYKPIHR